MHTVFKTADKVTYMAVMHQQADWNTAVTVSDMHVTVLDMHVTVSDLHVTVSDMH